MKIYNRIVKFFMFFSEIYILNVFFSFVTVIIMKTSEDDL